MALDNKNSSFERPENFKLILERISDAFVSLDNNWCYTYVNAKAGEIFNRHPESLIGKHIWTEFPEGIGQPFHLAYEKAMKEQIHVQLEEYFRPYDKWFENNIYPSENGLSIFFKDITEKKKSEQNLKLLQSKMDAAFRIGETGFWDWDIPKDEVYWSEKMYEIYDVSKDTPLKYNTVLSRVHPDDRKFHDEICEEKINTKDNSPFEYRVKCTDGTVKYVKVRMEVVSNKNDEAVAFRGTVIDITQQKITELLLLAEKEILEQLALNKPLKEILNTVALSFEKISPKSICSILLLGDDEKTLHHVAGPSLHPDYNAAIDGVVIGPSVGSCGTAAYTKKQIIVTDIATDPYWKDYKDLALQYNLKACWSTPILNNQQKVLGTFAIYYNEVATPTDFDVELITRFSNIVKIVLENIKKDEEITESEETFRRLFYDSADAILLLQDRNFIKCNNKALQLLGCSSFDEILNKKPWEISPLHQPDGQSSIEKANQNIEVAQKNGHYKFEWVHTKIDGTEFFVEVMLTSIIISGIQSYFTVWRDITDRKNTETALLLEANRNKTILQNMLDGYVLADTNGKIVDVNNTYCNMMGYSKEELLQKNIRELEAKLTEVEVTERISLIQKNGSVQFETQHIRKDKSVINFDVCLTLMMENGKPLIAGFVEDITARKMAEKEVTMNQEKIIQLNKNLEQKVKERTEQLQKTVKDLEEVNDLFVGREMRIIELKEEIEKLKSK